MHDRLEVMIVIPAFFSLDPVFFPRAVVFYIPTFYGKFRTSVFPMLFLQAFFLFLFILVHRFVCDGHTSLCDVFARSL